MTVVSWTTDSLYQAWADDKVFKVGDQLVNSVAFDNCSTEPPSYYFDSGDAVGFAQPGTYYFICGVPAHCSDLDQKFTIDVVNA
ncbi:blue copper protein [Artemisia annua]|uniref:Blue copper protein n=1 Tax=Artemisia annua TaxID=35608 RepID=A0A2U1KHW1_ARTAN|nr:blue copper protein [Artemisia annua]